MQTETPSPSAEQATEMSFMSSSSSVIIAATSTHSETTAAASATAITISSTAQQITSTLLNTADSQSGEKATAPPIVITLPNAADKQPKYRPLPDTTSSLSTQDFDEEAQRKSNPSLSTAEEVKNESNLLCGVKIAAGATLSALIALSIHHSPQSLAIGALLGALGGYKFSKNNNWPRLFQNQEQTNRAYQPLPVSYEMPKRL